MVGCEVTCGELMLCDVMSFHVMSFEDVVFCLCLLFCQCPIIYVMRREVRCCHVI